MTIDKQATEGEEQFDLPLNLSEWVEKTTLLEWIEAEVEKFDWQNPELVDYLRRNPAYRPKALLVLLTYAYATESFSSEEIERKCYDDTVCRLICENDPPSASELRRFRRENRGLLRGLLLAVLLRAVRAKSDLGDALIPPGLKRYLLDSAVERLDIARHMDSGEV